MYSMLVCNYLISVFSLCQPSRLARPMPQHKQHQQEKVWKLPSRYKKVIHIKAKKRRPHIVVSFKVSKLFFCSLSGFRFHVSLRRCCVPFEPGGRNAFVVIMKRFSGIFICDTFISVWGKWHDINVNNCRQQLISVLLALRFPSKARAR